MHDKLTPVSCQVACDSLTWHIKTAGEGPVCVLIHGTGASVHTWDKLYPLLSTRYTVVMVDLPGHADTRTPVDADLSLDGMATALYKLLSQQEIEPELIIGHSAGAAIMLELCLRHPRYAQRLVSINAAVVPLQGLAGFVFSPLARLSANSQFMARFFSFRAKNHGNVRKLLDSTGSRVDPQSFRRYAELFADPTHVSGVLRMMANWNLDRLQLKLRKLPIPIHLIAASNDQTIPLRDTYKLQQLLPADKVTVSVINGYGHLLHEEAPSSVAQLIFTYEH